MRKNCLQFRPPPFLEFFLCLSRACLGKMYVFIYKWLKNHHFYYKTRTCGLHGEHGVAAQREVEQVRVLPSQPATHASVTHVSAIHIINDNIR